MAKGHIKALEYSQQSTEAFNPGTGKGTSVIELVENFEKATGIRLKRRFVDRRSRDVLAYYADVSKAKNYPFWKFKGNLYDMCLDSWRWQLKKSKWLHTSCY